jgi:hypothetical protein
MGKVFEKKQIPPAFPFKTLPPKMENCGPDALGK